MSRKDLCGETNEDAATAWNSELDAIKNEFIMTLSHHMKMPLSPQTRDVLGTLAAETMNGTHPGINVLLNFAESYRTQLAYLLLHRIPGDNTEANSAKEQVSEWCMEADVRRDKRNRT